MASNMDSSLSEDFVAAVTSASTNIEQTSNVAVGIALSVTAASMNTLGINLQRLGQRTRPSTIRAGGVNTGKFLNVCGLILATTCGLVDAISFGYAPQSVLAPFGAMGLILNLLLAQILHGEVLVSEDIKATGLVFLGIATCLLFGVQQGRTYSPSDLALLATRGFTLLYYGCVGATIWMLFKQVERREHRFRKSTPVRARSGSISDVTGISEPEPMVVVKQALPSDAVYPVFAGMCGSISTLCAKVATELLKGGGYSLPMFTLMLLLVPLAILLVSAAGAQLYVLNRGLGHFSPLFVQPVFAATFVVSNVLAGGIFFNEFESFSAFQWAGYGAGISLVVSGVLVLTNKAAKTTATID